MRYKEWIFLLLIACLGIIVANFVGFKVSFIESLPGAVVLLGISLVSVLLTKTLPFKLPIVAYCSIIGLLIASPISPISDFVISAANKINFTAPLTLVGAFAGISIGSDIKAFTKQGWKMIIIALLVMTGTFLGSAFIAQLVLKITNAI